jgi:hypothetical protein
MPADLRVDPHVSLASSPVVTVWETKIVLYGCGRIQSGRECCHGLLEPLPFRQLLVHAFL